MEIVIDKRIELMTVIQTLCGYWDNLAMKYSNNPLHQCKYKENVKEYFVKHKSHETIKLYSNLCKEVMDIGAFIYLVLCYSTLPKLDIMADYENNFGKISISPFPYEKFISSLRIFYEDTNFEYFWGNNQNEYITIINDYGVKTELSENTVLDYLGGKINNYNIIISPLVMGNFGIKVNTNMNEVLHYSVISPYDYKNNKYIYGPLNLKKGYLWHEISHLTVNDLTRNYMSQLNIKEKKIPEIFVENLYTDIETIINEYIIRAITIRLFKINNENTFVEYLVKKDTSKGFDKIELVKKYIEKKCEEDNKLIKDIRYKDLMEYVLSII
jgi:hypothetical protein